MATAQQAKREQVAIFHEPVLHGAKFESMITIIQYSSYCLVGMMVGGGCGPKTIILRNPKCVSRTTRSAINEFLKIIFFTEFSTACLMHSSKHSTKLATATALLRWRKCLKFHGKKTFTILNMCIHCSLTVLALILLYGGHCFSI